MDKIFNIEAQIVETWGEAYLLHRLLEVAKEAGYNTVQDHWGPNAYDTYTIDEAILKFKPVDTDSSDDYDMEDIDPTPTPTVEEIMSPKETIDEDYNGEDPEEWVRRINGK